MTHVIIGANRGIGLEIVRQLRTRGDTVVATCRQTHPDLDATGAEIVEDVDVTRHETLRALERHLQGRSVDWLMVVAGVMRIQRLGELDAGAVDDIRLQFESNALGPLMAVEALAPLLDDGGKIGIVTSRMGSIADNTSGNSYGYRMSKAAVNMAGVSLAEDLRPRGISVALLHPGYVRTDMTSHNGHIDADESARGLIARMDELDLQRTGRFWHAVSGDQLPW